jgi:acetyl esterase/lipase
MTEAAHPPTRIAYGDQPDQFGELRLPPGPGPHPVVLLLHGGFWTDPYALDLMDRLAVDLVGRGWAVWNVEYRRVDNGGGIPATFQDVSAALDHVADLPGVDPASVAVVGHSAGGQLALWLAGTARRVTPIGVASLAGVLDLELARVQGIGDHAVAALMGSADPDEKLWARYSPAHMTPNAVPKLLVHGTDDDRVPVEQSEMFHNRVERARHGDSTLIRPEGVDHFEVIDPTSTAWAETAAWLRALLAEPAIVR